MAVSDATGRRGFHRSVSYQIGAVSPGVFELDSAGLVAARALPVVSGVQQSLQPVYQVNASVLATLPFDLSTADTQYDLDQINIGPLPVSLSGQGSVSIVIAADGEDVYKRQVPRHIACRLRNEKGHVIGSTPRVVAVKQRHGVSRFEIHDAGADAL